MPLISTAMPQVPGRKESLAVTPVAARRRPAAKLPNKHSGLLQKLSIHNQSNSSFPGVATSFGIALSSILGIGQQVFGVTCIDSAAVLGVAFEDVLAQAVHIAAAVKRRRQE